VLDLIRKRECDLVINTPSARARAPTATRSAPRGEHGIPSITTMTAPRRRSGRSPPARDRRRSPLAAGDPRGGAGDGEPPVTAPRPPALRGRGSARLGRLSGRLAGRSRGPSRGGQFYMLAAAEAGAQRGAPSCAGDLGRRDASGCRGRTGLRLEFPARRGRPGPGGYAIWTPAGSGSTAARNTFARHTHIEHQNNKNQRKISNTNVARIG